MSLILSRERQDEIDAFGRALEEGAWSRLEKLTRKCGLPRQQKWRLELWQAATGLVPGRLDTTFQAWDWLRSHQMSLDKDSSDAMFKYLLARPAAENVSPLLNAFAHDHALPDPLTLLDVFALRRTDPAALAWLYDRGLPLDPSGPKGKRLPTLQRVLENLGLQPATHEVLGWLLDHGVHPRTLPTECGVKAVSPLGFLIGVVQSQDLSRPALMACATQLWELLEAAGDDPYASTSYMGAPVSRLVGVPPLQAWYESRKIALQRQEQTPAVVGASRRRIRS